MDERLLDELGVDEPTRRKIRYAAKMLGITENEVIALAVREYEQGRREPGDDR